MKVSLIVSVYNVSKYIERCLKSVLEQTLDDIEIVVVNDATTDDSMDKMYNLLEDYPSRNNQVVVINHDRNLGISKVREDGFNAAKGDYIQFVDGDDFMDINMAEVLYNKATETHADMVICDFYRYDGMQSRPDSIVRGKDKLDINSVRDDIINRSVPPFIWCRLIKRELLEGDEMMWPVMNLGEDTVIGSQVAYRAIKIEYVNRPLYYYRYNPSSVTHQFDELHCLENYESFKANVGIYISFLEREGLSNKYSRGIVINKLRTKNRLLPLTRQRKYRRLWWSTYPEINRVLLFGNKDFKSTYRERLWIAAIMSGLYPRFRNHLMKRKFSVSSEWL